MALNSRVLRALSHIIFVWSFLNALEISNGSETENDIYCLKSIKDSLEDPYNRLKDSWNFSNKTEGSICRFTGVECWNSGEIRVFSIQLSGMMLRGQFPRGIKNCSSLTELDLSGNELSGPLPFDIAELIPLIDSLDLSANKFSGEIPKSIGNCNFLNVLKLDNNQLTGEIPKSIGNCTFLYVLKLDNNQLTGEIPNSIGNCTFLYCLKLDNNQLTGEIPPEMSRLNHLRRLDASNNQLSGPVPVFDTEFITAESFANNEDLCGRPLKPCPRWRFDFSFKSGFLLGYEFSAVLVLAIFFSKYAACTINKKRDKKMTVSNEGTKNVNKEADQLNQSQTKGLLQEGSKKVSKLVRRIPRMSLAELSEATANFNIDNVVGLGKIGTMYKGVLSNGQPSAIKRLYDSQSFEKQFASELKALDRVRHENIVSLLGYCIEGKEKLLVYEYISNGNLYDWLHATKGRNKILKWPLRIKIAIGIARGLAWFHHYYNFNVVHLNLSSKSILLDQNFRPQISNFGGSIISNFGEEMFKNTRSNTFFIGDDVWELGYVKKDVYDFGILLLELIIGKDSIEINNYANNLNESLVDWIAHLLTSSSDLYNVIDESLIGRGFEDEIFELLRIAYTCLKLFPSQRPTTLELYNAIYIFGERVRLTHNSEILRQSETATASIFGEIVEAEIT